MSDDPWNALGLLGRIALRQTLGERRCRRR